MKLKKREESSRTSNIFIAHIEGDGFVIFLRELTSHENWDVSNI